ncbi:MAG TPA: peptidoglycan recognition family protein [Candidatus Saccharimonadales bacterium]|nr:peptidoglycan recognition family protein [Candidatus Saccharimonadales bacterium]
MKIEKLSLPWVDSTKRIQPTAIVLHWWQVPTWFGGIKWFIFALKRKKLSVQFAVTKDGEVYQLTESPDVWCRHARCANNSSIGIEIQGLGRRDLDENQLQFQAVVGLVKELCRQFIIDPKFRVEQGENTRFYGITSHKVVDKYCSGKRRLPKRDVHDEYVTRLIEALQR